MFTPRVNIDLTLFPVHMHMTVRPKTTHDLRVIQAYIGAGEPDDFEEPVPSFVVASAAAPAIASAAAPATAPAVSRAQDDAALARIVQQLDAATALARKLEALVHAPPQRQPPHPHPLPQIVPAVLAAAVAGAAAGAVATALLSRRRPGRV
eukprot:Unigene4165_Nuclearia_a/m.12685 Unigene4165_Nuclearia_a/g.12685  ORF Unigene4165_Nuclearia_a/g.12685 Unigene4165_Nuclearia_a/m.12685 type:complete len:151 (-) Unigene4165_Nuclearia_a:34-486(-)